MYEQISTENRRFRSSRASLTQNLRKWDRSPPTILLVTQDTQLSQRDRAAGCVIVFAKSRILELGDNDLRIL